MVVGKEIKDRGQSLEKRMKCTRNREQKGPREKKKRLSGMLVAHEDIGEDVLPVERDERDKCAELGLLFGFLEAPSLEESTRRAAIITRNGDLSLAFATRSRDCDVLDTFLIEIRGPVGLVVDRLGHGLVGNAALEDHSPISFVPCVKTRQLHSETLAFLDDEFLGAFFKVINRKEDGGIGVVDLIGLDVHPSIERRSVNDLCDFVQHLDFPSCVLLADGDGELVGKKLLDDVEVDGLFPVDLGRRERRKFVHVSSSHKVLFEVGVFQLARNGQGRRRR